MSIDSPLSAVKAAAPELSGLRVIDIGCGGGAFVRQLAGEGAIVTGVDPNAQALPRAVESGLEFVVAGAQALPFESGSFDLAVFVNSLHHVPSGLMTQALREASRVTRPEGLVVVVEPLAAGSFFEIVRLVEDETEVRAAAQQALREAVESGLYRTVRSDTYDRIDCYLDAASFVERIVAVDPARRTEADARKEEIEAAYARHGKPVAGGREFVQPIKVNILAKSGRAASAA